MPWFGKEMVVLSSSFDGSWLGTIGAERNKPIRDTHFIAQLAAAGGSRCPQREQNRL